MNVVLQKYILLKMNFMKSKNKTSTISTNLEGALYVTSSLSPNIKLITRERRNFLINYSCIITLFRV